MGQREGVVEETGPITAGQDFRTVQEDLTKVLPVPEGVVDPVVAALTHVELGPLAAKGGRDFDPLLVS